MAQTSFFANTMTLAISTVAGSTLTVGILGGVEITAEWEFFELYGQESIFREDVARTKAKVSVTVKTSKFHPKILGTILGTENIDKDIDGETNAGTTQAEITDSNTVTLYNMQGTVTGKDGSVFLAKVTNVYFETMQYVAPEDEFMGPELTGIGDKAFLQYPTI